jgi:hypothetical protein
MDKHVLKLNPRQSKYASILSLHGLAAVVLTIILAPLLGAEGSTPSPSSLSMMVRASNDVFARTYPLAGVCNYV